MIPKAQTARLDTLFGDNAGREAAAKRDTDQPPDGRTDHDSFDSFALFAKVDPFALFAERAAKSDKPKNAIPLHIPVQPDDEPMRAVVNPSVKRQVITHLSDDAIRRRVMEEILPADFDADDAHLEVARQIADGVLKLKDNLIHSVWMERLTCHDDVYIISVQGMIGALLRDDLAPGIYQSMPPENRLAELKLVCNKAEELYDQIHQNSGYALVHLRFLPPANRLFAAMAGVDQLLLDDTQDCFTPEVRAEIAQHVVRVAATAGLFAGFARCPVNPETLGESVPIEALAVGGGGMNVALAVITKGLPKLAAALKPEAYPVILKNCQNAETKGLVVSRALDILEEEQWIPKINMVFHHLFPSEFPVNISSVPRAAHESVKVAPQKIDASLC